eukprot:TRINITY_DN12369_c0_g1_i1.p1 TRINITY_DN12369_c0_g1~~TRINITY_DN12369_c0_g1_i1.p1  ORF type:complete len:118 (+),score=32.59 TRINITY_DN12369_c0_g1_i1:219-572(+)
MRRELILGNTLVLDHLGPIVINKDGTLSRITNWEIMSPREKQITRRRISERNRERRDFLVQELERQKKKKKKKKKKKENRTLSGVADHLKTEKTTNNSHRTTENEKKRTVFHHDDTY